FIKEVYQVLSLASLSAISWNQNVSFRHDLSQDLAHFWIGGAYHSAYIAVGISHTFFSPLSNLFSYQLIERSAVNDPVLELTAGRIGGLYQHKDSLLFFFAHIDKRLNPVRAQVWVHSGKVFIKSSDLI